MQPQIYLQIESVETENNTPFHKILKPEEIQAIEGIELLEGIMEIKSIEIIDSSEPNSYYKAYLAKKGDTKEEEIFLWRMYKYAETIAHTEDWLNISIKYDPEDNNKISIVLDEVMHTYTPEEIQSIKWIEFAEQIPEMKACFENLKKIKGIQGHFWISYSQTPYQRGYFINNNTRKEPIKTVEHEGKKYCLYYTASTDTFVIEEVL